MRSFPQTCRAGNDLDSRGWQKGDIARMWRCQIPTDRPWLHSRRSAGPFHLPRSLQWVWGSGACVCNPSNFKNLFSFFTCLSRGCATAASCTGNGGRPTEAVGERKDAGTNFPVRRSFGTHCAPAGTAPTDCALHTRLERWSAYMCACRPGINPSFFSLGNTYTSAPGGSCPLGRCLSELVVFSSTCALADC